MKLFIDTSVILAACCSATGSSRDVFRFAAANKWALLVTSYVLDEVRRNLFRMPSAAADFWATTDGVFQLERDVFTIDWPVVFLPAKDRPILLSAWAWADTRLTLDRRDFHDLLGENFYGLRIAKPGDFLERERLEGRLR